MARDDGILRLAGRAATLVRRALRSGAGAVAAPSRRSARTARQRDQSGVPDLEYRPRADGRPDPGEIVWTWVPYDEGDGRGKDRPVLVIGRRGGDLLGLMLTSKDHDRDLADESRHGRVWTDIGTGAWDSRGRPSEIRLDRLLELDPAAVRREGAALDRARFDRVVAEARRVQGW
ncbi:type II toxin-antitoxin system PemK/MazF family toxin [Blastococcus haudaquaticus]|uniref:PemK-like, MazF-like toxin of type II toxin-antitoxin system n=1 Tax=Blastococcus haudaquaticus TaxID=1938745 RepID=A0A286GZL7_9ACTN|nr:type II toxin-antitoxin system PemK/MazF family toxin [Blastococcus haudaquaticus]SOE00646.1 PemK-like, MazF-like toxin of type II toxin-antitoxin system [Blastococcus haudaquaticus]